MSRKKKVLISIAAFFLILIILGIIFNNFLPISFDFSTYNEGYELEEAFPNLEFDNIVHLTNDGSNNLFVLEQEGRIRTFENSQGVSNAPVFLDITDRVACCGEIGLLGMAFDPEYNENGYFYVDYTADDPLRTVISRFHATDGVVEKSSEQIILEVEQPYSNHNAGTIAFGPDGMLYVTFGDGGSAGDPKENGQNLATFLGSILRINVTNSNQATPYQIPEDNPFVDNPAAKGEIWAYGLRNPWKISFDSETGDLWAGDVGQNRYEEIDIIKKGNNYGWNTMEGFHCYDPDENCDTTGLTLPIVEYGRDLGKSVSGGLVYRGSALTGLIGKYIFADYVSGRFWHLNAATPDNPQLVDFMKYNKFISGFGVDSSNEIYVLEYSGTIHKIVPLTSS